jgi:cilia- and flagella-associated protein 57
MRDKELRIYELKK